jgi:hypothetical protein
LSRQFFEHDPQRVRLSRCQRRCANGHSSISANPRRRTRIAGRSSGVAGECGHPPHLTMVGRSGVGGFSAADRWGKRLHARVGIIGGRADQPATMLSGR